MYVMVHAYPSPFRPYSLELNKKQFRNKKTPFAVYTEVHKKGVFAVNGLFFI